MTTLVDAVTAAVSTAASSASAVSGQAGTDLEAHLASWYSVREQLVGGCIQLAGARLDQLLPAQPALAMAGLETARQQIAAAYQAAVGWAATVANDGSQLAGQITALGSQEQGLQATEASLSAQISSLRDQVAAARERQKWEWIFPPVAVLDTLIDELVNQTSEKQSEAGRLALQEQQMGDQVGQLQAEVGNLQLVASSLGSVVGPVSQLNNGVADLGAKVKEIEQAQADAAQAAALSAVAVQEWQQAVACAQRIAGG